MILETCEAFLAHLRKVEPNTKQSQGAILELKTLPIIVVEGPRIQERKNMRTVAEIMAKDVAAGVYVKEKTPRWYNLSFDILIATDRFSDLLNRIEGLSRFAQSAPLLTVTQQGTGRVREYGWDWQTFPQNNGLPNFSGVYEAKGSLVIYDVEVYSGVTRSGKLIQSIDLGFGPTQDMASEEIEESMNIPKGE